MRYTCVLALTLILAAPHVSFAGAASPLSAESPGTPHREAQIELINLGPRPESRASHFSSPGMTYRVLPSGRGRAAQGPMSKSARACSC